MTAVAAVGCLQLDGDKNEPRIANESGVTVELFWAAPGFDDTPYAVIPRGR